MPSAEVVNEDSYLRCMPSWACCRSLGRLHILLPSLSLFHLQGSQGHSKGTPRLRHSCLLQGDAAAAPLEGSLTFESLQQILQAAKGVEQPSESFPLTRGVDLGGSPYPHPSGLLPAIPQAWNQGLQYGAEAMQHRMAPAAGSQLHHWSNDAQPYRSPPPPLLSFHRPSTLPVIYK